LKQGARHLEIRRLALRGLCHLRIVNSTKSHWARTLRGLRLLSFEERNSQLDGVKRMHIFASERHPRFRGGIQKVSWEGQSYRQEMTTETKPKMKGARPSVGNPGEINFVS